MEINQEKKIKNEFIFPWDMSWDICAKNINFQKSSEEQVIKWLFLKANIDFRPVLNKNIFSFCIQYVYFKVYKSCLIYGVIGCETCYLPFEIYWLLFWAVFHFGGIIVCDWLKIKSLVSNTTLVTTFFWRRMWSIFYDEEFRPTLGVKFRFVAIVYVLAVPGDVSCTDMQCRHCSLPSSFWGLKYTV